MGKPLEMLATLSHLYIFWILVNMGSNLHRNHLAYNWDDYYTGMVLGQFLKVDNSQCLCNIANCIKILQFIKTLINASSNESTLVHNARFIDFACMIIYKFMLIMFMYKPTSYLHNGLQLRLWHNHATDGRTLTNGKVLNTSTLAHSVICCRLVLCQLHTKQRTCACGLLWKTTPLVTTAGSMLGYVQLCHVQHFCAALCIQKQQRGRAIFE